MIPNNYYPVKFKDFLRIKSIGNYTIMYAILNDRIHFEMAVENQVFVSQRFLEDIESELKRKAINYNNDKINIFLKMTLTSSTFYRYWPTVEMQKEIKKIKLYDKIIVKKTKDGIYSKEKVKIIETDLYMKALDGNDVILFGEKE